MEGRAVFYEKLLTDRNRTEGHSRARLARRTIGIGITGAGTVARVTDVTVVVRGTVGIHFTDTVWAVGCGFAFVTQGIYAAICVLDTLVTAAFNGIAGDEERLRVTVGAGLAFGTLPGIVAHSAVGVGGAIRIRRAFAASAACRVAFFQAVVGTIRIGRAALGAMQECCSRKR